MSASNQFSVGTTAVRLFAAYHGTSSDPQSLIIKCTDATGTLYVGGPNVSSSNGFPLTDGQAISVDVNEGTRIYAIGSEAATTCAVFVSKGGLVVGTSGSEETPGQDLSGISDAT